MSSAVSGELYPVVIIQDRYQGVYSRGKWLAVANADERETTMSRVEWAIETGPSGDDLTAAMFWASPPAWVGVGSTPDAALADLASRTA